MEPYGGMVSFIRNRTIDTDIIRIIQTKATPDWQWFESLGTGFSIPTRQEKVALRCGVLPCPTGIRNPKKYG
jgi:hypothetical protein